MKEKTERNLKIILDLSEGSKEEEIARKNHVKQSVVHIAAERTIRKLLIDDEQINYLSVRAVLIQKPEIKEIAKSALERLEQMKLRGLKLPHKLTRQVLQPTENL